MSRTPDSLAPSWLPRQRRRHVDRALRKLMRRETCSVCGTPFEPNTGTATGFDARGNAAVAGECCVGKLTEIFGLGLNLPLSTSTGATDEARIADIGRRSGVDCALQVNLSDSPWKDDDRIWFEQNPMRAHRMRLPFSGEYDAEALDAPPGHVLIVLVRQVEPGSRIRPGFYLDSDLLPVPDDEAAAHALFEVVTGAEVMPPDVEALDALIRKYSVHGGRSDA
jgi:hypothetical protein